MIDGEICADLREGTVAPCGKKYCPRCHPENHDLAVRQIKIWKELEADGMSSEEIQRRLFGAPGKEVSE